MFYTYILKSLKNGKRYVGQTSKDIFVRLKEHNKCCNQWTKNNRPFIIIYFEEFDNKTDAIKRERFLKSGQGRKYIDSIINNPDLRDSSMVEQPAVNR